MTPCATCIGCGNAIPWLTDEAIAAGLETLHTYIETASGDLHALHWSCYEARFDGAQAMLPGVAA
jgi:Na+-translocating ferredoxin:NAD+ oxidoreductase RNF subunit RnfB